MLVLLLEVRWSEVSEGLSSSELGLRQLSETSSDNIKMKISHSDRVFEGCQRFGMHLQVYRKWKWMFVNARLSASYLCQATIYLLYSIPSATYLYAINPTFNPIHAYRNQAVIWFRKNVLYSYYFQIWRT